MRFAHIADCHLGAWSNHPELRELPLQAFQKAVDMIISEKLDFVVLAGDFFDSSMPAVDVMRFAAEQLMRLKLADIPVYAIAGSHDYSPTGKTMLSVLEAAGLLRNAHMRWLEDKSGARIFGVEGLRGGLDREHFDELKSVGKGEGYKILLLHSAVDEISGMKGVSFSQLPKGFDYYASGHVHERAQRAFGEGLIGFPGPLFPTEFSELEMLGGGSFSIVDVSNGRTNMRSEKVELCDVKALSVNCDGKSPHQVETELVNDLGGLEVDGSIVLIKATGILASGKPTDICWKRITDAALQAGAKAVKRSVNVTSKDVEMATIDALGSLEQIEQMIIEKNIGKIDDKDMILRLMPVLALEKSEDEKNVVYEEKIKFGVKRLLDLGV